jgi:hypothetical protein
MKYSRGLQTSELGGQISLGQWSFRLAFRQAWVILVVWAGSVLLEQVRTFSGNSLHPGLHHGVKDFYVLLGVDPLAPCQRRGGGA